MLSNYLTRARMVPTGPIPARKPGIRSTPIARLPWQSVQAEHRPLGKRVVWNYDACK